MKHRRFYMAVTVCALSVLMISSACLAIDIEDQLSAYTGENGVGYLQPMADAVGSNLNSGLFQSAHIPTSGMYFAVELKVMSVLFSDDDRMFDAKTEAGFSPSTTAEAPTVVGPGEVVIVPGEGGTSFIFPGGFDLNSFALVAPQLRFGSYMGTEALIRYFALDVGDTDMGTLTLFGFGLRHSISQYLGPDFPVDLAGGFFWQSFKLGENNAGGDLLDASAFTIGVQASKRYGAGMAYVEPYAGLSMDRFSMDVSYEIEGIEEPVVTDIEFETSTTVHLTLGLAARFAFVGANAEYNIADQSGFSLGLSFGM
jgi:hypothetical protein